MQPHSQTQHHFIIHNLPYEQQYSMQAAHRNRKKISSFHLLLAKIAISEMLREEIS